MGLQEVPDGFSQPESEAHATGLRGPVLYPPFRPQHTDGGDAASTGRYRTAGQGTLCGHLELALGSHTLCHQLPQRTRRATTHLSRKTEHAEQGTDGRRYSGPLPSGRCRLHCLLTLGTGSADGPLSERYSYRLAHGSWKIPQKGDADRRTAGANPTVERRSRKQGYDAGRMGTALDTGTAGRHLCTRRSQ